MSIGATLTSLRELSKSGIVALVLISVMGGYFSAVPFGQPLDFSRLALTLFGILFLASGSSALNQLQEKLQDGKMNRTARRPLPSGRLGPWEAGWFILVTLFLGFATLLYLSPSLAALGALAVISYNGFYTLWWKRNWAFAAVPGAVPGALPVLMGYTSGQGVHGDILAPGGVYLFMILFTWQMPHFWVLALRYKQDYAMGGFPTLPVACGEPLTIQQITLWCLAYIGISLSAPMFLSVGYFYFACALILGAKVLWELHAFVKAPQSKRWLRFFLWINLSLILLLAATVVDRKLTSSIMTMSMMDIR